MQMEEVFGEANWRNRAVQTQWSHRNDRFTESGDDL